MAFDLFVGTTQPAITLTFIIRSRSQHKMRKEISQRSNVVLKIWSSTNFKSDFCEILKVKSFCAINYHSHKQFED